ncbi:MAG: hypothetical protein ACI4ET_14140, partial [Bilifractor sp.]
STWLFLIFQFTPLYRRNPPEEYHVFLLNKPVILNKGVWHQTLTLTDVSEVKITENLDVYSDFYDLPYEVRTGLSEEKC